MEAAGSERITKRQRIGLETFAGWRSGHFESTVFPGATEDICGAIIAESSGLDIATSDSADPDRSFYLGYSPERINPGDRRRKLENIVKVTSGSTRCRQAN